MKPFKRILFIAGIFLLFSCQKDKPSYVFKDIDQNWKFKQTNSDTWMPAEVPGCVHTNLFANGIIDDPFYGTNEKDLQWIETKDWDYKTTFDLNDDILGKENIEIIFNGLDTYAKVTLNNHQILVSENMFIRHTIECKSLLKGEGNEIKVTFRSPVNEAELFWENYPFELPGGQKVMTRKAGFHFGWDWGPRMVTSGIWRPIVIHAWNKAKINDIQIIRSSLSENKAKFEAIAEILSNESLNAEFQIDISKNNISSSAVNLKKGIHTYRLAFEINDPKLWWTNGLGEAHLYKLRFELKLKEQTLDIKNINYGIRTLELIQDKDDLGESFYFKLNGKPIFIKGANYIPQDNFQNNVSEERYKKLFKTVVSSNMNMLRVWGGGIYEEDIFYELCDKNGILVWQDFMFACAMYPSSKEFLKSIKTEVIQNIKRLRNHPCIALWCGNNEIDEAWHNWGWSNAFSKEDSADIKSGYDTLFYKIIPEAVKKYDPERPYHSSSPKYGRGNPLSQYKGDSHYWGVWHDAEPFENYEEKVPRFMSEFGFQSFPFGQTIKKFSDSENMFIDSEIMLSHQKHPRGNELIKKYMSDYYIIPEDFEQFIYVSQLMQAEGIKMGIEAHRRAMPHCGGTLYWQLNDCWPVISWSSVDYYGKWKALQYFVKKAYKTYMISFEEEKNILKLYIVSDDLNDVQARLDLNLINFNGDTLWSLQKHVKIEGNTSKVYLTQNMKELLHGRNKTNVLMIVELYKDKSILAEEFKYFTKPKALNLNRANIKYSISEKNGVYEMILRSDKLAKNVYLESNIVEFFSDNFFDLPKGIEKKVTFRSTEKLSGNNAIRILSFNDILLKN